MPGQGKNFYLDALVWGISGSTGRSFFYTLGVHWTNCSLWCYGHCVALATGKIAIILAAISNTAAKGVLVFSLGSRSLRRYIWPAMIIMLTIGLVFAFLV